MRREELARNLPLSPDFQQLESLPAPADIGSTGVDECCTRARCRPACLLASREKKASAWEDLLLRLNEAVMQSVVDGQVIHELHL
jgi:hypothetical protein